MDKLIFRFVAVTILWLLALSPTWALMFRCTLTDGGIRYTNVVKDAVGCLLMVEAKAAPAGAQLTNWTLIATLPTEDNLFLDYTTLTRVGTNWKIWAMWRYKKEKNLDMYPKKQYRSAKLSHYLDCSRRTIATAQQIYYADDTGGGRVIDNWDSDLTTLSYADVVPESVGSRLLLEACMRAQQQGK